MMLVRSIFFSMAFSAMLMVSVVPVNANEKTEDVNDYYSNPIPVGQGNERSKTAIAKIDKRYKMYNDKYRSIQWNLSKYSIEYLNSKIERKPIKIAILDTPIDRSHEDFEGVRFYNGTIVGGMQFGNPDSGICLGEKKLCDHGTAVAGIIAAAPNNGKGISGISPGVEIIEYGIASSTVIDKDTGLKRVSGNSTDMVNAIRHAVDSGAKIINISWGSEYTSDALEEVCNYAESKGVVIVASAGNKIQHKYVYPAALPTVIGVAAFEENGSYPPDFTRNNQIDIAAPHHVPTLNLDNTYSASVSGTSFAAPHVTAAVALMMQ